jgi:alkylhydroperoxidase/carboxymuconolactone decarboxylase family protein YurZ
MATYTEVIEALKEPTRALSRAAPDAWKGFGALHQAAMADCEVPARTKELVALARSPSSRNAMAASPITPAPRPGRVPPTRKSPRSSALRC